MKTTRLITPTPSADTAPLLIKYILQRSLAYEPDTEIVYRDQMRYTYRDFRKRVAQAAHALTKLGVESGDVIGVMDFDSHRYLELYFAIPMIGAVLHTINYRLSPAQVLYTMNHAEDSLVLCHQSILPLLEKISPTLDTVKKYVILKDKGQEVQTELSVEGEYEDLLAKEPTEYDFPDFDENSMATLFYTTGTTGNPKGVCFSHRQLVLHTLGVSATVTGVSTPIRMSSADVYMPLTPMFHVHAWGVPYVATLLGMKQIYPGMYHPDTIMELLEKEKVSFSHCVPTILGWIVNHPRAHEIDLSRLKLLIGGSALPKGLARSAVNVGINVLAGYGMSETCPVLSVPYVSTQRTYDPEEELSERIKTGKAIMFVELQIMDDDGKLLPWDGTTVGELVTKAPWLTLRYFKEEERSEELWKYGWMHTGDMAVIEPNGTVVIVDRKKDVIKSGGEWISSLEIESLISSYPKVKETAVVGIPDARWGERPVALIVPMDGQSPTDQEIKTYLSQFVESKKLSKWAIPDMYRFVEEIPKTSVGKINKKEIRKQLLAE